MFAKKGPSCTLLCLPKWGTHKLLNEIKSSPGWDEKKEKKEQGEADEKEEEAQEEAEEEKKEKKREEEERSSCIH